MLVTAAVSEIRGSRAALRFLGAVERRGDPPLRGDHVRAALEEVGGHPDRDRRGGGRELGPHRDHRRGVASRQRLERAQRLLVGEIEVLRGVAEGLQVRLGEPDVVLVADPDAEAVLREAHEPRRCAHRLVGERLLHARLGGEEPAFRDLRGDRLAGVLVVECGRRRTGTPAAAAPERTRPQRSSSQFTNTPTPSSPLESPLIFPPPRARRLTCG